VLRPRLARALTSPLELTGPGGRDQHDPGGDQRRLVPTSSTIAAVSAEPTTIATARIASWTL
jgi:hypothetical protein